MSFIYGQQTTRKVLDLNPTYWWTLNNSVISAVSLSGSLVTSVTCGGSANSTVTGNNWDTVTVNGKRWGYGSAASGKLYSSSIPVAVGYGMSAFVIARIKSGLGAASAWPYFFDLQTPRVSFSMDSFGYSIGGGEMSIYMGSTYGYDSGDITMGGRLNTSTHTICGCYAYFNSNNSFMSWTDAVTNTINTNLINNNNTVISTSTDTGPLFINNRHSNDRGNINVQMAELIMFPGQELTTDQRNLLWDYLNQYYYINRATAP